MEFLIFSIAIIGLVFFVLVGKNDDKKPVERKTAPDEPKPPTPEIPEMPTAIPGLEMPDPEPASERTPITARRVLTKGEIECFNRLCSALPDHIVLAQVSFSALVTARGWPTRNTFNRKVADFVILNKAFDTIAVIELDDWSHKGREDKDAERDEILQNAGIRVIRYPKLPEADEIKRDFI